jgi:PAS domain S-box-containing protein
MDRLPYAEINGPAGKTNVWDEDASLQASDSHLQPQLPGPHTHVNGNGALALALTQQTLELLLNAAPVAIVAVNERGEVVFANNRLRELFGYEQAELIGASVELLMPERFHEDHLSHRSRYFRTPHNRPMGQGLDLLARRKDGSEFPIEAGLSHIHVDGHTLTLSSVVDLSRRKQTEEMLEQRVEERTREIERRRRVAEGLSEVVAILNSNRPLLETLDYITTQASQLLGADAAIIYRLDDESEPITVLSSHGLPVEGADGDSTEEAAAGLDALARAQLAVPLRVGDEVYGGLMLYYSQPRHFSNEEIELAVTFSEQAKLAIENARLRAQSEQMAVAAERNRIARDLHDSVTQTLFSASLIAEVLPRLWDRDRDESKRRLEELRSLTRGALAEMRTLLLELRPSALVDADLNDLLRQLCEAAIGRARIPVALTIEGSAPVPPDVKIALYHITQEALNNVTKHARATAASIELLRQPGCVALSVRDNGRGFVSGAITSDHLGLTIMQERADDVDAQLHIQSALNEGTQVSVTWNADSGTSPSPSSTVLRP